MGIFPYDRFGSFEKMSETKLSEKEEFHSMLSGCDISSEDYERAQKVWKYFNMKDVRDAHDLYLRTEVILLADVFEYFRDMCLKNYELDPAWHFTAPGLSWDAFLKKN